MQVSAHAYTPTGTAGLDDILSGGLDDGEFSVYASFEEHPVMLARHAGFIGHDLETAVAKDRFQVLDMRPLTIKEKMTSLRREIKDAEDAQDIARLRQEIESLKNQLASQLENREFVLKKRFND